VLLEGENGFELAWPTTILNKAVLSDGFGWSFGGFFMQVVFTC